MSEAAAAGGFVSFLGRESSTRGERGDDSNSCLGPAEVGVRAPGSPPCLGACTVSSHFSLGDFGVNTGTESLEVSVCCKLAFIEPL